MTFPFGRVRHSLLGPRIARRKTFSTVVRASRDESFREAVARIRSGAMEDGELRAFLEARVSGSGAETWLTEDAAKQYEVAGLYAIGYPDLAKNTDDLTSFSVFPASPGSLADGSAVWEVWVGARQTGQGERICFHDRVGHDRQQRRFVTRVETLTREGTS